MSEPTPTECCCIAMAEAYFLEIIDGRWVLVDACEEKLEEIYFCPFCGHKLKEA